MIGMSKLAHRVNFAPRMSLYVAGGAGVFR